MVVDWDQFKKSRLLYQNMLPSIKKQIPYDQINRELTLVRLAREAENLAIDENLYRPPPPPTQAVFPELAYMENSREKAPSAAGVAAIRISNEPPSPKSDNLMEQLLSRLSEIDTNSAKVKSQKGQSQQSNPKPREKVASTQKANQTAPPVNMPIPEPASTSCTSYPNPEQRKGKAKANKNIQP